MTSRANPRPVAVVLRASAAELPEVVLRMLQRWINRSGIDPARSVELLLGVSDDRTEIAAMRRAAEACIEDAGVRRLRLWLAERPTNAGFTSIQTLRRDYQSWAAAEGSPVEVSAKAFSIALSRLGHEHRYHPRRRTSEFRIAGGRD